MIFKFNSVDYVVASVTPDHVVHERYFNEMEEAVKECLTYNTYGLCVPKSESDLISFKHQSNGNQFPILLGLSTRETPYNGVSELEGYTAKYKISELKAILAHETNIKHVAFVGTPYLYPAKLEELASYVKQLPHITGVAVQWDGLGLTSQLADIFGKYVDEIHYRPSDSKYSELATLTLNRLPKSLKDKLVLCLDGSGDAISYIHQAEVRQFIQEFNVPVVLSEVEIVSDMTMLTHGLDRDIYMRQGCLASTVHTIHSRQCLYDLLKIVTDLGLKSTLITSEFSHHVQLMKHLTGLRKY